MPLCFPRVSYLYFVIEIAKRKLQSMHKQPSKFLTENNARWTVNRVYRHFAGRGECYRTYDADKN